MSTGKRLAKRSILGTKVMVPGQDGLFHPGFIQAVKTYEDSPVPNRYSVRFEETGRVFEFAESSILGPGFNPVTSVQLPKGQPVYITHNNREINATVVRHDEMAQEVLLVCNNTATEEETVLLKTDEVRLFESRKSARLVNSDTDFSKLADISNEAKANKAGTKAIEVPRSDYVQIAGSRKRRTSENVYDDPEEVLSECSAAMLLMKLSCSPSATPFSNSATPFSPQMTTPFSPSSSFPSSSGGFYSDLPSPSASSESESSEFRSSTPSPPLAGTGKASSSVVLHDEGIVKDLSVRKHATKVIIYQCTFPGCGCQRPSVSAIESHVRKEHLSRPETIVESEESRDHEEEFYYTEIEHPVFFTANKSLADHLDMARPAHEDPAGPRNNNNNNNNNNTSLHHKYGVPILASRKKPVARNDVMLSKSLPNSSVTLPVTIAPSAVGSPGKMILISPPVRTPHSSGSSSGVSSNSSSLLSLSSGSLVKQSPVRRVRDGKKCRKVYGLEQRELWCTQCKWKKACARFGANATERNNNNNSLLVPAGITSTTVKAIKF